MNDFFTNYRNNLLAEQIRSNNAMLNASVPTVSPVMAYQRPAMPNQYYGESNQPNILFGQGMLGYETPLVDGFMNGMLSGRMGLDKARLNWNNQNNDVDLRFNNSGDASINWTGRF